MPLPARLELSRVISGGCQNRHGEIPGKLRNFTNSASLSESTFRLPTGEHSTDSDMADDSSLLVLRAVAGDRTAQGELALRMYPRLVALCQSRVPQRADAEELAQETLLRAMRSLDQLSAENQFEAWVRGIAGRVCIDWHRNRIRRHSNDVASERSVTDFTIAIADGDEHARLRRLIGELPSELREVLLLHYYEEMTYDDMARWLGVARATINERLTKARHCLRRQLIRNGGLAND